MGEGVEVNGIDISTDASDAGEAGQGSVSGAHESAKTAGNADDEVEF